MPFTYPEMDRAAEEAADEYEELIAEHGGADPVSEPTAFELVQWLRKYRNTAGYKRMVKWLFEYYGV